MSWQLKYIDLLLMVVPIFSENVVYFQIYTRIIYTEVQKRFLENFPSLRLS